MPEESTPAPTEDLSLLLEELTTLSRREPNAESDDLAEPFRQRIELADKILDHPDLEENQRLFVELTKLQACGALYSIDVREKNDRTETLKQYRTQIDKLLADSNDRLRLEAIHANANLAVSLYLEDPNRQAAQETVTALNRLVDFAPQDPLIQTAKRLLLERVWNSEQPLELFEALSSTGDKAASIVLPTLATDESSTREVTEFKWAKHFAGFNDLVAMSRLANMYEEGKGTRVNYSQAVRWYEKLARLGDLHATTKLGDYIRAGKGYSVDAETAFEYYQKAATSGYRVAQFKLGECFRQGSGVEASDEDWRKWIKTAAFNATAVEVQQIYESIDFQTAADSFQLFYRVLVDQNPDDIYYLNNLAYSLLIGTNKEPERSLELVDKAIAGAPENFDGMANFQDTRAHALKHLGKYQEAAEIFESILSELEDKKPILGALVDCYAEFDEAKAQEYRDKLKELAD